MVADAAISEAIKLASHHGVASAPEYLRAILILMVEARAERIKGSTEPAAPAKPGKKVSNG